MSSMDLTYGMTVSKVESGAVGWDIGGVHSKAVRLAGSAPLRHALRSYELQRAPDRLPDILRSLADELGAAADDRHAVTMTAELSQHFRTKRDGVAWVTDGFAAAFGEDRVRVLGVDGAWRTLAQAKHDWRAVAAANWAATARVVAKHHHDALLIDIGSTTTDIIPIVNGAVAARGLDDPGRLASKELVYMGAVRTPVEALVAQVPYQRTLAGVSAENFALIGDVHVWRGMLHPSDYDTGAPDGRPTTRDYCGDRLARVICGDREMLTDRDLDAIAVYVAEVQLARTIDAVRTVAQRHPLVRDAVVVGLGSWLGRAAAEACGLRVVPLAAPISEAHIVAPAASAALLALEH